MFQWKLRVFSSVIFQVTVAPRSPAGVRCFGSLVQLPTNVDAHLSCLQSVTEERWDVGFTSGKQINFEPFYHFICLVTLHFLTYFQCSISFGDQLIKDYESVKHYHPPEVLHPQEKSRLMMGLSFRQVSEKDSLYCCACLQLCTLCNLFPGLFSNVQRYCRRFSLTNGRIFARFFYAFYHHLMVIVPCHPR